MKAIDAFVLSLKMIQEGKFNNEFIVVNQTGLVFDFQDGNGPVPAHRHVNGGGWVADTAHVDDTAYVGPDARVYGNARVFDNALVFDNAQVYGNASIYGNARVFGNARVYGTAYVSGNTIKE